MILRLKSNLYAIAIIAFTANLIWENLHDFLYVEYNPLMRHFFYLGCTLGDVLLTLIVYYLVGWVQKDASWLKQFAQRELLLTLTFSILIAASAEWLALKLQLWDYNEKMQLIPLIRIGLSPFLQITLLPAFTFYLSHSITSEHKLGT